jgi:hypothetical protein
MSCDYISTFEDYKKAQKLYLRYRNNARMRLLAWMYGLPIATVCLALLTWHLSSTSSTSGFSLLGWLTLCCFGATVQVVVLRPWNLRRCYNKMRRIAGMNEQTPTRFDFDDNGVISGVPNRSEVRFFWNAIQDFAEDEHVALLFISKKRFLFIPKRVMAAEQWDQLRSLITIKAQSIAH